MTERPKHHHKDELEPDKIPEDLVRVHDVPDEATGTMLADLLRDQGIDATLKPVEISMLPGVESVGHGYWGTIEVLERDQARAQALIREYLVSKPRSTRRRVPGADPEDAA
jgi:hypothetical protein